MKKRIKEKIKEIEIFIQEIEEILPSSLEEYLRNFIVRGSCERYFEKIIEAVIDVSFMIIRDKKLELPNTEEHAFNILMNNKIIGENLCKKLKDAKGMRNFIVHQYGRIDDELVFHTVAWELIPDVREFINKVKSIK